MGEIVGRELKRWSETLEELNEYDITLVNILLKYYEALIEAGGTAGGKRANKLVEYIGEKKGICDKTIETLSFGSETNTKKIKKLKVCLIYTYIAICHGKCYFNYRRKKYGYAVKKSGM